MIKIRFATLFFAVAVASLVWTAVAVAHPAAAKGTTITVVEGKPSEFKYTVTPSSVPVGKVTFKVTDSGAIAHDFKVCSSSKGGSANSCTGKGTIAISPGGSSTLVITFKTKGTYEYLCTLPGHAAAGMKGDLKVT